MSEDVAEKEIDIDPDMTVAEVKELVRQAFHLHSVLDVQLIVTPASNEGDDEDIE